MMVPVFRFAPSPNGELHLGHAYSALLNAKLAGERGGRVLLRIEDIDTARCTPEFEQGIYRDLGWLGIEWERPVRRQSDHFDVYVEALARLRSEGLVYPAFMSRGEIRAFVTGHEGDWPRDPDGAPLYPPLDRQASEATRRARLASGAPYSWRLDMGKAIAVVGGTEWTEFSASDVSAHEMIPAAPQRWGDVVIARSDVPTSYHLSVVVDDALQGITHVVRGRDLYEATSVQRVLQKLLGFKAPAYHHHRLILGPDGRKLSKSERSTGLRALREAGRTPEDIRAMLGF
ncbi:MAG: tRNA glutamyl-Q(34) synthetase GluQRS [Rhizobiaceae bacterium]|nr:tRNA glutamyl-Q(34) synthetase GluQRS [Rhizobiaceae bacterium]